LTTRSNSGETLADLAARAQACTVCAEHLPHAPRPVLRVSSSARLLIVGQAPGRRVHETGIPWNDPSGDTLREWLGMTREQFYDASRIAIAPAGLCYPGTVKGSDLPPRPECAPLWHPLLRAAMPDIRLTLLIGAYAQAYYLGPRRAAPWPTPLPPGARSARRCFRCRIPVRATGCGSNAIPGSGRRFCPPCANVLEWPGQQAIMAAFRKSDKPSHRIHSV
jgi:uracil-DNA glycosylase